MKTIDLRHLVSKECNVVKFVGDDDKKEYELPVKKNVGAVLMMQEYMIDFNNRRTSEKYTATDLIELSFITIAAWIKSFYPDKSIEWTKANINSDVMEVLTPMANDLFFPKSGEVKEQAKPKRSRKKAHRS